MGILLAQFFLHHQELASIQASSTFSFSWNLLDDVQVIWHFAFMRNAFVAGTAVALVAALVGYFVVLRQLSFAGHALSHIGFAGATGAILLGMSAMSGLLVFTMGSALLMGLLGKRLHGRDVVTGIVLAWVLGLGVLFLSLYTGYATEAYAVLFGQILGISVRDVFTTVVVSALTLVALVVIYRPLLFASLDEEIAEARGIPTQGLAIGFMIILAVAVTVATQVVGVLMIFSLLITPAAIAERLTTRPPLVLLTACLIAVLCTWAGLFISFYLPYPVSFFLTSLVFLLYVLVRGTPFVIQSLRVGKQHHSQVFQRTQTMNEEPVEVTP